MDGLEVVQSLAEGGLAFALAGVVIYWYRADSLERLKHADERTHKAEERAKQEREDKLLMVEIVRANTQAMTRLEAVILQQEMRQDRADERD